MSIPLVCYNFHPMNSRDVVGENGKRLIVKRPTRLFIIALLCFLHGLSGFYRFAWLIGNWNNNWALIGPAVLWFELNASFIWGLGSILISTFLWAGIRVGGIATTIWLVLFSAGFWIDRVIVASNQATKVGWPFFLLINLLVGWFVIFSVMSPISSAYFRRIQNG